MFVAVFVGEEEETTTATSLERQKKFTIKRIEREREREIVLIFRAVADEIRILCAGYMWDSMRATL